MKEQEKIVREITNDIEHVLPQQILIDKKNKNVKLMTDHQMASNLSGGLGALFIRFVLRQLRLNEHHIFRWRLENKYMQYLIFGHYARGCVPKTFALSELLGEQTDNSSIEKVRELFSQNFFLKATLGHGSGRSNTFDRTLEFDDLLPIEHEQYVQNEKWILQEKLKLKKEFRIHTFGKDIIYGLTFNTMGFDSETASDKLRTEGFLLSILYRLPDTIVQGILIGWDIGLTDDGKYYILEGNFTGFHPEYCAGFQTSGYVDDKDFGPIICVWLNYYFRYKYSISISEIDDWLLKKFDFFNSYIYYISLLPYNTFRLIFDNAGRDSLTIVFYFDNDADADARLKILISHFQLVDLAAEYYVITTEGSMIKIGNYFKHNHRITVLAEKNLFNHEQYELINQLSLDERKKNCYYEALKLVKTRLSILI